MCMYVCVYIYTHIVHIAIYKQINQYARRRGFTINASITITRLCYTVPYYTILFYTILHYTTLYCTTLDSTRLY